MSNIYGNSIRMMNKSLDYLWLKQGVTSNNIANAETVGYKSQYVTFEREFENKLQAAISAGNPNHVRENIAMSSPKVHQSTTEGLRLDGNNVDTEVEMIELTRAALQYQSTVNSLNADISRMRSVIKGS